MKNLNSAPPSPPPPPSSPPPPSTPLSPSIPSISSPSTAVRQHATTQYMNSRMSANASSQKVLPPELTDLLNRTCSIAAASPRAAALLHDALSTLDAKLSTTPPGAGSGENRNPNTSPSYLEMSPRARAQLSNLRHDCNDVARDSELAGSSRSTTFASGRGRAEGAARARCIMPAPGEHAPPLWTTALQPPPPPTPPPSSPSALPSPASSVPLSSAQSQQQNAALVGQHVSVYCYIDDVWRTAVVTALLSDGAHELVYLDGYTERTVLDCRLWRRVSE